MLERFGQLAVACLELAEQSNVLDRDHCLVCKGLEQRELLRWKRPGLGRATAIAPIGSLSRISGTERRFGIPRHRGRTGCVVSVLQNVRDRDDTARQDRAGVCRIRGSVVLG